MKCLDPHPCVGCQTPVLDGRFCPVCMVKPVYANQTLPQLHEAFDAIKDPNNWKNPIQHVFPGHLTEEEILPYLAAVIFFTGGQADWHHIPGSATYPPRTLITAPGYYISCGA